MPELYNQELIEQMKAVQRTVNSAINQLNALIRYGPDMTSGAKIVRTGAIRTSCNELGITTDDWLGKDDPG